MITLQVFAPSDRNGDLRDLQRGIQLATLEISMTTERQADGKFKKGICPNPNGRPRKDQSVHSAIMRATRTKVTVTENGKRKKIDKLDATTTQLANKAASGDLRAGKMLLDYAGRAETQAQATASMEVPLTLSDAEIVTAFLAEYRHYLESENTSCQL